MIEYHHHICKTKDLTFFTSLVYKKFEFHRTICQYEVGNGWQVDKVA